MLSVDSLFHTNVNIVYLKQVPPVGEFTADLNGGIIKGQRYYYAVFQIDSAAHYKLCNIRSFVATGSKKIKIDAISPLKADIGDTLTITGKYFNGQSISVRFDEQQGYMIPQSDSVLKVVVTGYLTSAKPLVTIRYNTTTDTVTDKFSLFAPVITSFTTTGTFRDVVVIKGDHFRAEMEANEVKFGNVKATITKAGKKQLEVTVPDDLEHSSSKVSVASQFQSTVGAGAFQIRKPEITQATSAGNVGDPVTIEGKYFHPEGYRNTVILETTPAESVSGNTTKLNTTIPNGAYPKRKATIKVKVLDDIVTYNIDLNITDKWVPVSNSQPFDLNQTVGAFTVNNTSYVLAGVDYRDPKKFLWKFNPANFSWQQMNIPFDFETGVVTSVGNKAYLFANKGNSSSFWEYDVPSDIWTKKSNFITGVRYAATLFPIGDKVYFGLGSSNNELDNSFYEYNIAQNSWKRIADYPSQFSDGVRLNPSAFVLNNKAYVGGGASNTGMYNYYSYTPGVNVWTRVADFPDARMNAVPFVINGYGYVAGGIPVGGSPYRDYYQYDPNLNAWKKMKETIGTWPLGTDGIDYGFAFINHGNVYIGCRGSFTGAFQIYQAYGSELK